MSQDRPFAQIDVFGAHPYRGNPVAVVLDAEGLTDEAMQALARWTHLSETTFVLPASDPAADYRVRIFTPGGELPFAGHPTLGTAHAWLEHGGRPAREDVVVQECTAGLVDVRREPDGLAFAAPPVLRDGPLDEEDLQRLVRGLGISREQVVAHQWVDNGPGWAVIQLATAEEVLALEPDFSLFPEDKCGVIGHHPAGHDALYETRGFVPSIGVPEDPVTGSLGAGIARWLIDSGAAPRRYLATQGVRVGSDGVLAIEADEDGRVWVGGSTVSLIRGRISI